MSPSVLPPGWYPTPDGSQQYWDGQQWLSIPPPDPADRPNRRTRTLVAFIASLVVAAVIGGGLALFQLDRAEQRAAAEHAASASAAAAAAEDESARAVEEASAQAAEEAASAEAAEQASIQAAEQAEQDAMDAERDARQLFVTDIEAAIQTMAEEDLADGLIDGTEVFDVSCSPVAGGSIGDLDQETTALQCFASTEENDDVTWSGFYYDATVNWTTGEYTYGPAW